MGIAFSYLSAKQSQLCIPSLLFPPASWLLPLPSLLDPQLPTTPPLRLMMSPSFPQCTIMNMEEMMPDMDQFLAKRRAVTTITQLENTVSTFPTVVSKLFLTLLAPRDTLLM